MIVKGVKISELVQRDKLTGEEMIPFQDQFSNGKLNMKSIIDHFQDVTGSEISLQSLVNIKQFINSSNDLTFISSNPGDVYYNKQDKQLYLYQEGGTYSKSNPSSTQLYVLLEPLDSEKTNAIYRWDNTVKEFVLPSYVDDVVDVYATYTVLPIGELTDITLYKDKEHSVTVSGETGKIYINNEEGEPAYQFRWTGSKWAAVNDGGPLIIGEITGTAYDGGKGKHNTDILNSMPDSLIYSVKDFTNDGNQVKFNYGFKTKQDSGLYMNATDATKVLPVASSTLAGIMTAADKVKLDTTLPNAIETEKNAREQADSDLQSKINKEIQDRTEAISNLESKVDSNNSNLSNKIDSEISRATQAEETITTDYKTADTVLNNKIDTEISNRESAISGVEQKISTEINRAQEAEQSIREAYALADSTLQSSITDINNSKGKANGIATLDSNGLVPSNQLPSYVDDVIEVANFASLPETGEAGKIYVTLDNNLTYRWSGTQYIEISQSLALGETSSTAYPGDKGKETTDKVNQTQSNLEAHINNKANPHEVTIEQLGLTKAGAGNKFLSDKGDYREIIEDTAETVRTTSEIPVAGGPLADLLNDAGINTINTSTSMQDILMQLFTKEMWPTNLIFKEGTITANISQPTMTLSNSGLVEVGTTVTVSAITITSSTNSTTARSYSGFTYGYSAANDSSKDSLNTSITVNASGIASTGDNYTLKRTINNNSVSATPNTDYTQVKLDSTTFKAIEGANTVKAETTGTKYSCKFAAMPLYYACSNLGKTDDNHKSSAKDEATITSSVPSNSKTLTVIGVYPYYTNKDNITTFAKLALTSNKTLDITFVSETASNKHAFKLPSKFTVSKITLLNTLSSNYEDYDINKFVVSTESINVQDTSVEYKVYTRNDGTNGSSSFKITFA